VDWGGLCAAAIASRHGLEVKVVGESVPVVRYSEWGLLRELA
jgi:hypothetical protein